MRSTALALLCAGVAFAHAVPASSPRAQDLLARGEYLSKIMDCHGCHTNGALAGKPDPGMHLAGSQVGFRIPDLGFFYPPNLTPDPATGLGSWSEAEIVQAIRTGTRPDGRRLAPVMPWQSYAALTDADAFALAAYLKSLPPVRHAPPRMAGPGERPAGPYLSVVMP
jgi:mono/diheme cytochrome c family protein